MRNMLAIALGEQLLYATTINPTYTVTEKLMKTSQNQAARLGHCILTVILIITGFFFIVSHFPRRFF